MKNEGNQEEFDIQKLNNQYFQDDMINNEKLSKYDNKYILNFFH